MDVSVGFFSFYGVVGTYKMTKENVEIAIPAALEAGYRLFDTATIYRNEEFVGETLRKEMACRGIARSSVFITSKLQTKDQGYEAASAAIDTSLAKMGVDYIDLYLIHWPGAAGLDPSDPLNKELRIGSWRALEEALVVGKLRSIGVSNYMLKHLQEMEEYAKVMPMVNQIELHPAYYPEDVIGYCQSKQIVIQAYSSLGRGKLLEDEFMTEHSQVVKISERHRATISQVYLRWALQHNWGILPKSNNPHRIKENASILHFELNEKEMHYLHSIHIKETQKICWDPIVVA